MALQLRRNSVKKIRAISTLVAVFALVIQPMYAAVDATIANASALPHSVDVRTEQELIAAAANKIVTVIHIRDDIELTNKIVLSGRDVNVKGHNHKLSFSGTDKWDGEYVIQAYENYVTLGSLAISGGDAAVYANGATLRILGTVDVSDNKFGGIEVSQGDGVTRAAVLNTTEGVLVNSTEKNTKPTVWIDEASKVNATVNGNFTETTHIGKDQKQYYLSPEAADITATNVTKSKTYNDVETAIDAADARDEIRLEKDISLANPTIRVRNSVVINGNGKFVYTTEEVPSPRGPANGKYNAAFIVMNSGVEIKDVTIDSVHSLGTAHGVVVDKGLQGVKLSGVTVKNGAAGVIVNGSEVSIDNITTYNNSWYGINLDGKYGHATLSISGENSHNDFTKPAIFSENYALSTIVDEDNQYIQILSAKYSPRAYVLKGSVPHAVITAPALANGDVTIQSSATGDYAIKSHWFEVTHPDMKTMTYPRDMFAKSDEFSFKLDTSMGEGQYKLRYVATDVRGVVATATHIVDIDKTKPTIQNLALDETVIKGDKLVLSGKVYDKNLLDYQVRVQTSSRGSIDPYNSNNYAKGVINTDGTLANLDVSNLTDGDYLVRIWATDRAGNSHGNDGTSYYLPFTIDRTPPVIDGGTYSSINKTLTFDTDSDAKTVTLNIGDVNVPLQSRNDNTWIFNVSSFNVPGEEYLYTAIAADIAGNYAKTDITNDETGAVTLRSFSVPDPFVGGREVPQVFSRSATPSAASSIALFGTSRFVVPTPVVDTDKSALGARDTKQTPANTVAALEPSAQGWKIFGIAWFWWVLLGALISMIWWWIAGARRRSQEA